MLKIKLRLELSLSLTDAANVITIGGFLLVLVRWLHGHN